MPPRWVNAIPSQERCKNESELDTVSLHVSTNFLSRTKFN